MSLLLGDDLGGSYPAAREKEPAPAKPFVLPPQSESVRRVYAYLLQKRCIDREILNAFVRKKLIYYAAFAGCSAETEASFETVSFLAKKVDELKLPCVLTIEGKNHKLAETIVQSTAGKKQKVLTMDSMQSMTSKDAANGATYLSVMEQNLSVLKEALG